MGRIALENVTGAAEQKVQWLVCSGCTEAEALEMAQFFVEDVGHVKDFFRRVPQPPPRATGKQEK